MKIRYNIKRILVLALLLDVFIIVVPIFLNFLINLPSPLPQKCIIGNAKDWLSFWGVYIGSIGSLIMAGVAFVTILQNNRIVEQNESLLNQNKEQLNELKRQWEEEHRPRLNVSIIIYRKAFYIKIKNIGKGNAKDIRLSFNNDFVRNLPKEEYAEMYKNVEKKPFVIEENEAKYILIGFCDVVQEKWEKNNISLKIFGTYCSKYIVDETFHLEEFTTQRFMAVNDALWEIADGLSCPNSNHYPIQKSLDVIAKKNK